jgi:hypothetical protein
VSEADADSSADDALDHERNTALLDAELPERRYTDASYLHWLYEENPLGRSFWANADEDGKRMAHYAVVPQRYRNRQGEAPFVFSLHAVTSRDAQRKGYFSTLGQQIYEEARQWGALGVIGVSNDNSTPPVVKRLDFRLLGPLPVKLVVPSPVPASGVTSHTVTAGLLDGSWFTSLDDDLAAVAASSWTNAWPPAFLRWRLSAPNCGPFAVHIGPEVSAITTASSFKGVPVAVVLKLIPRGGGTNLSAGPIISAACRFHRAPLAVYAGFNRHVRVRGLRPPRRLQPSPLNLIFRSLSPEVPKSSFRLDTFEFLDMDAY